MSLDVRHLRHLLAIVEHGTVGRAAKALKMTQPALSRSVKALEEEVGGEPSCFCAPTRASRPRFTPTPRGAC